MTNKPTERGLTGTQIFEKLKEKQLGWTAIATVIGKSANHIRRVAHRNAISRPVAEAICKTLELEMTEVFPDVEQYVNPPLVEQRKHAVTKLLATLRGE